MSKLKLPHLHSVFICPREQLSIGVAKKYLPSLENVCDDHAVQMSNVRGLILRGNV
jgi:hypothetical protein